MIQFAAGGRTFEIFSEPPCGVSGCDTEGEENKDCFPIPVSSLDANKSSDNLTCIKYVRTAASPDCSPREQINLATSYLDGSQIYGSTAEEANHRRAEGKLSFSSDIIING